MQIRGRGLRVVRKVRHQTALGGRESDGIIEYLGAQEVQALLPQPTARVLKLLRTASIETAADFEATRSEEAVSFRIYGP